MSKPKSGGSMASARQFSVTLPPGVAEIVEAKIRSGAYASVREPCGGVQLLLDRDAALEKWLREEVVAGHCEYLADPSKGVAAEDVLGRIKARRAAR
jgi:Arc/MetJ-type ribon-helix-helix transcriptional regulator